MFSKNLRFYRLKNSMTMRELASRSGLSAMAISNYEKGSRMPDMDTLKALAQALNVQVSDFLAARGSNPVFQHGEFRKTTALTQTKQEFIQESVEDYFSRFYTVVELLGGEVLPEAPMCHALEMSNNIEENAKSMRRHLGFASNGPINDLIAALENKGILVYVHEAGTESFSGRNGFVNGRPYIVLNGSMSAERSRSNIAHELAHLFFVWPDDMSEKEIEDTATAIGGAFLFPREDAIRELGVRRRAITNDMALVSKEYGVSMFLLAKRAQILGIITDSAAKNFYIRAGSLGWRTSEPSRIEPEAPHLFEQLVFRAVSEEAISVQRGAELLQMPYSEVVSHCYFDEG